MSFKTRILFLVIAAGAVVFTMAAQDSPPNGKPQISPRQLFYCEEPPCDGPAPQQLKTTPKPASKLKRPAKPPTTSAPPVHSGSEAPIVPAVVEGLPLALRYTLLDPDHGKAEVSADKTFHANDHIQLAVETNSPGYLYVINQGSSGEWTPMFPRADINHGSAYVEGRRVCVLPSEEHGMRFDEHTGTEHLFIAFSRVPVSDLEEFIYSLKSQPLVHPGAPALPPDDKPKQIVAQARISNDTVEHLRTLYSRDLIVEKITPNTPTESPGAKKENAVYVANPSARPDSPLITDLHLEHR